MSPDTNTSVIPDTRNIPTYSMAPYCQHFRFNDWHLLKTLRDKNSFLQEAAQTSPPSPVDVAPQAEPRQRKGIRLQAQPSDLATHAAGLPWP